MTEIATLQAVIDFDVAQGHDPRNHIGRLARPAFPVPSAEIVIDWDRVRVSEAEIRAAARRPGVGPLPYDGCECQLCRTLRAEQLVEIESLRQKVAKYVDAGRQAGMFAAPPAATHAARCHRCRNVYTYHVNDGPPELCPSCKRPLVEPVDPGAVPRCAWCLVAFPAGELPEKCPQCGEPA